VYTTLWKYALTPLKDGFCINNTFLAFYSVYPSKPLFWRGRGLFVTFLDNTTFRQPEKVLSNPLTSLTMRRKRFNKNFFLLSLFINAVGHSTCAQQKDTAAAALKISGYVDGYYAYYTDSLGPGEFQQFPTISPRSNAFGLNIAAATLAYDAEKVRGVVTLHYGDIPLSAWSVKFNNIMEAHAGVRLCKKLWFDAGFFRTHFGTEGLLPKENIASSISIPTFYEPYFESGVRFDYLASDKLTLDLYVLNGYNTFEENNDKKSFGLLATYKLGEKGNIGYSNYIGDDSPQGDTESHLRVHNNVFFNYKIKKLKMQLGVDYCMQQNSDTTGEKSASMFSALASFKYQCGKKLAPYIRGELINDDQGFMTGIITDKTGEHTGIELFGITAGVEYLPTENSYIRLEGRELITDAEQEIFYSDGYTKNNRTEIMMNVGVSF
jgi:hypothetical protein